MIQLMDRLGTGSPAKGILAFLSTKSPKEIKKAREEERRRHAEAMAKHQKEREERQAIRAAWELEDLDLGSVVRPGRPTYATSWRLALVSATMKLAARQVPGVSDWRALSLWPSAFPCPKEEKSTGRI